MSRCQVCTHQNRALIESELSSKTSTEETGKKWGIPGRSLRKHRQNHMTQEQIAGYRQALQPVHEVDVESVIRTGGQTAVVALGRLMDELIAATKACDTAGALREAATNRQLQLKVIKEQAALAMLYPSTKRAITNNLVLADGAKLFDTVAEILKRSTIEEARQAFAEVLSRSAREAMARIEAKPLGKIAAEIMDAEFTEAGEEAKD